jgi:hypothetical protein
MASVNLNELEDAMILVDGPSFVEAWVSLDTGKVHLRGEAIDPEWGPLPGDIDTSDRYAAVPGARDLDLGHAMVFGFTEAEMPEEEDRVRQMFRRQGAYRQFGRLLDERGLRERWHAFRHERTVSALREWCEEKGLQLEA